jgi:hypothetical protein
MLPPDVIAGQVDVLPAQRGQVLSQRIIHRQSVPAQQSASPESWPGDGSITSGVPKKPRQCGQAAAMLGDSSRPRETELKKPKP